MEDRMVGLRGPSYRRRSRGWNRRMADGGSVSHRNSEKKAQAGRVEGY